MGLFDNVAGAVLGKMLGEKSEMAKIAIEMFNQYGGIEGILAKFKEAGLTDIVATWVESGENAPISSGQIMDALGSETMKDIAGKFGLSPETLGSQLAQYLPSVIDKMTPDGKVNRDSNDLLGTLLGMFK